MQKVIATDYTIRAIMRYKYSRNHKVIDVSDLDTSRCTDLSDCFMNMRDLEKIIGLDKIDLSKVVNMNGMLQGCYSLISVDFSGCNLSNIERMNYMFCCCCSLISVDFSGCNLSNVQRMYSMFQNCHSLTSVNFGDCNLSNVQSMNSMFQSCHSLTSVNFNGCDLSNVSDMNNMFYGCYLLTFASNISNHTILFILEHNAMQEYNSIDFKSLLIPPIDVNENKNSDEVEDKPDANVLKDIDDYKHMNDVDKQEIEKLKDNINAIKARIEKRTQLIQALELLPLNRLLQEYSDLLK